MYVVSEVEILDNHQSSPFVVRNSIESFPDANRTSLLSKPIVSSASPRIPLLHDSNDKKGKEK